MLSSIFMGLILNLHHRKNAKALQQCINIRKKLEARQVEGFIRGGWKLYLCPSVFLLDSPIVELG